MIEFIKEFFYFHFYLSIPLTIWILGWSVITIIRRNKKRTIPNFIWIICLAGIIIIPLQVACFSLLEGIAPVQTAPAPVTTSGNTPCTGAAESFYRQG